MNMIKEEYAFSDMEEYLYQKVNLLIAGLPSEEERSKFFSEKWNVHKKSILYLSGPENGLLIGFFAENGTDIQKFSINLYELSGVLKSLKIEEKIVLLDMSSLSHVLIMLITKQLVEYAIPKLFFASYIRPRKYHQQSGTIGVSLCEKIQAVNSVPGFAKREGNQQTLCAFLGFESIRLKNILESIHNMERFIPIVAFPSGTPQWYNVTMWNCMDILQSDNELHSIRKCFSESVFEAVNLLDDCVSSNEKIVLAPLGTRPHSLACALFACHHRNCRIIYDYPIEISNRAEGIESITIYHLSSFLKS